MRTTSFRAVTSWTLAATLLLSAAGAAAQHDHAGQDHAGQDHAGHDHAAHGHAAHGQVAGIEHAEHDLAQSEKEHSEGAHGDAGHGDAGHGHDDHGHGHVPHFSDINWVYGLIGEKEGVEPSLLWRPPGTPIPLGALILNTAILFFLIGRFGGPGIKQGLADRKQRIAGDIERAAKMRAEAEEQLAHYEEKLQKMEAEMARIKKEMQEQAEADRARILDEAKERRAAIEAESKKLVEQELAHARQEATLKAVTSAVAAARDQIQKSMQSQDQERLANEFLTSLETQVKKSQGAMS